MDNLPNQLYQHNATKKISTTVYTQQGCATTKTIPAQINTNFNN